MCYPWLLALALLVIVFQWRQSRQCVATPVARLSAAETAQDSAAAPDSSAEVTQPVDPLHTLIERASIPHALHDGQNRILFLNAAFAYTFGYTLTDIPHLQAWWSRAYPEVAYREQVMAGWQSYLANVSQTRLPLPPMEVTIRCKTGEMKTVIVSTAALHHDTGSLYLTMLYDISLHKQIESALLRSNADLEQFAYSVSHDMRQPLRAVTGHLQLLERSLKATLDADNQENLAFALEGAQRMDAMIVSLLDYSRVGRKNQTKDWLESAVVLEEALGFLAPAIAEHQAHLLCRGVWPRVFASRDQLTRLFQNLLGNALKYHEPGQAPQLALDSTVSDGTWRVAIQDQGIGIDPQQATRLFQFFTRLQSRSRFEGNGMGLALCRRIIEYHQGRIWVESPGEGLGSTFIFELPLGPEDGANPA